MSAASAERVVSRYRVHEQLASGGMGVVYRVLDTSTGQERALKRLNGLAVGQPFLVEAFEREYQVLAGIDHPRIIRVFDYGVDEVGPYYTMELLEGQDLRKAAPKPYREACLLLRDVATSLALLHARRLIHRDLSPRNVRMTLDGRCKLIDFGALASFGNALMVAGTPPAIPPEALTGASLDQRADLYSLGALAYWLLTERHAYPAQQIDQLAELWRIGPRPPSAIVPGIPRELDALVLSLLSADPLARPASAAEVIARLSAIGELAPEGGGEAERLAEGFLLRPRFVGRAALLEQFEERTEGALRGHGAALRVEARAGMGRTRLLEEVGVRAQIAGASVVRVDASMHRDPQGTARALAVRTLDALPTIARDAARPFAAALAALGRDVELRLTTRRSGPPTRPSAPPVTSVDDARSAGGDLDGWFVEISRNKPLVIEIDNVDAADDSSLGLLVALAKLSTEHALLLVVTERESREPRTAPGLVTLRSSCTPVSLSRLSTDETLELVQSLFGDAPNVERLTEWLNGRIEGNPLHCLEILRQLVARQIVRYIGGMWALPANRPDVELPEALEDTLLMRLESLSPDARSLAECLSLPRQHPTFELCRLLLGPADERRAFLLLDELARNDVLYVDQDGYRFSSGALRDALLQGMRGHDLARNHRRLGEAYATLATPTDYELRMQAGWHLIRGGQDLRGADMIAAVTHDSVTVRKLFANLHGTADPIDAALQVYKRLRRSTYARMPLLAALAHAGYYEGRHWGERYGDEALDVCEDLCGVRTARSLRRFFGRWLALMMGLLLSFVRFRIAPSRDRPYPFEHMLVQLFGAVTTLTGTAALSLDVERATHVAGILEVFSVLPARLTPVGIYQFCVSLREIGRERHTLAYEAFDTLQARFGNPAYYPTLPSDARQLYVTATHYARGALAIAREDGRAALESADALDASGLKLYAMIASQLRFLYYTNRGEFAKADIHREQVELHAAHVGSAWQVETWEAASLIPIYATLSDIEALTRVAHQLEETSRTVPSLRLYSRLATLSLLLAVGHSADEVDQVSEMELSAYPPRGFIGWAAVHGFVARGKNERGQHAAAKVICERALAHITDADRQYVTMFLGVDIEMATAQAGLGETKEAFARIDGLLARFRASDHPLVQGSLHEARARMAWMAGRVDEYEVSLALVEFWYRRTGTPALIAKCDRLAELGGAAIGRPAATGEGAASSQTDAVTTFDGKRRAPEKRTPATSVRIRSSRS